MTQEKIVALLRDREQFVREEELTVKLGISAEELWEQVRRLRDNGYGIEIVPHLGYKMIFIPDCLRPSEVEKNLATVKIGRRVVYSDKTSSTMDDAVRLASEGAQEGTVAVAESQSSGRGRAGRSWFSPSRKGIYLSLLLRPQSPPAKFALLNLLAAVAVSEAIRNVTGVVAEIKWPNDILLDGRKAGGILTEAGGGGALSYVVVGVGLNVNNEPQELLPGTAAIKEFAGVKIDRVSLLQEMFFRIEKYYLEFCRGDYALIIEKWRGLNATLGRRVKVILPARVIEGEAIDIEDDGGLLVRRDSGLVEKVMSGDVIHCGVPQRG